jgi:hypothetical protein
MAKDRKSPHSIVDRHVPKAGEVPGNRNSDRIAFANALLPGLPKQSILACYTAAPGNEIASGKFTSPESSAALVANTFGFFINRAAELPPLPGESDLGWPALTVTLECVVRFPWAGGRHPCLDVLIETDTALIGIESKRYEPFRSEITEEDSVTPWSTAYSRPVWGDAMRGYERIRDDLPAGRTKFARLDAAQLVKHATYLILPVC